MSINGHYLDVPEAKYHADPRLGSSGFKKLATSPGHFDHARRNPSKDTDETRLGRSLHLLAMEPARFGAVAVLSPYDEYRKDEAKKWKAEQEAAGLIPLKSKEWAEVHRWRDALLGHRSASALLKPADDVLIESSIFFDYAGVPCKARPDVYRARDGVIVDVKTTACAHESEWDREVANTGLYFQPWLYLAAAEAEADCPASRFVWVVVSKEAPYAVWCREAGSAWLDAARREGEALLTVYRDCTDADVWPVGSDGIEVSEPPAWFQKKEYVRG